MTRAERIRSCLQEHLRCEFFNLMNESASHRGPSDAETHFRLEVVSEDFVGLSAVKRHQRVYDLLKGEFETGLHALSLHCLSVEEWEQKKNSLEASPPCRGGSDSDQNI